MRNLNTLFTAMLLLCSTIAMAHDIEVDGIYYNITDEENKTLEVTYKGDSYDEYNDEYTGDVVIPKKVVTGGVIFNVTSIGSDAFSYCSGLTSIEIPGSVTSIGDNAFEGCSGLTSITIPNSVTSIGRSAFYGCSGLTNITIPNSVTSIGRSAFSYCSGLTSIVVESGNSKYDSRENCNAIIETESNTLIAGCKNSVIPGSVTSIGENAFLVCSGLTSITIPNNVTSIGRSAFSYCSGLTSITIPNSVTSIGIYAFSDCSGLTSIVVDSGNSKYDSRENCNAIIETESNTLIAGCKNSVIPGSVTSIGENAFLGCSGLTSITIPNSVTSIGEYAFYYCSGLTSITIPNSVTSIGDNAFYGTAWYNNQPDGLLYLNGWLLGYKGGEPTGSITIADGTKSIGRSAFSSCSGLTSITIPNSVTSIGEDAFRYCSGLTSITIPNSVTSIGNSAFYNCSGLASVTIGNSVTSIEDWTFYGCSGLTSITIPNSVTSLGLGAFDGCSGLTNITIPNSVASIGSNAFYGTAWYNNQPDGVVYAGKVLYKYKEAMPENTEIIVKEGTLGITNDAFSYCSGLISITIPNSVTSIGNSVFHGCSGLTSITIPNSVTSIGEDAFRYCSGLENVKMYITDANVISNMPANVFEFIDSEAVLYVLAGTNELWENSAVIGNFSNMVEFLFKYYDAVEYSYDDIKVYTKLEYHRTFDNTGWQTWYMPFDVELQDIEDELEVARLNDVHQYDDNEDGEVDRTELEVIRLTEGTLRANYPYVVKAKSTGEKVFVLDDVAVQEYEEYSIDCSSVAMRFVFTGSNSRMGYGSSYYQLDNSVLTPAAASSAFTQKITSLQQLSNDKVYTLRSERTFLLYSDNADVSGKLCAGNGSKVGNVNRDVNDVNQHFRIEKIGSSYYLYSVGAGKYVKQDGTYSSTPTDALVFNNVGGEYQWQIGVGSNYLNSQVAGQTSEGIIVNNWSTADAGNCYIVEELLMAPGRWYMQVESRNSMFKAPAQVRLFVFGEGNSGGTTTEINEVASEGECEMENAKAEIFDLQGRKVENPANGLYIINGKKVLVK